jgi:hypothetical protein
MTWGLSRAGNNREATGKFSSVDAFRATGPSAVVPTAVDPVSPLKILALCRIFDFVVVLRPTLPS